MKVDFNYEFNKVLDTEIPAIMSKAIEIRRHIHMYPETGFDTHNTESFILEKLKETGIEILPSEIGVMARIEGKDHSRMVALRSDIDALNLDEINEVPYKSQVPHKMHACGHDGHTAMLLCAAEILQRHRDMLPTDVLLVFQPAEEGPNLGGARVMLADMKKSGMINRIDNIFGIHLFNDYPVGKVGVKHGALASSTDEFYIKIKGKGGHAGQPEKCIDALSVAVKVVDAMESFMSRRISPLESAVFAIGMLNAGSAINIVAENATIGGTLRCQVEEMRSYILENMDQIVRGVCSAFGATCEIEILHGLPPLVNDTEVTDFAENILKEAFERDKIFEIQKPMMGAEDFSYFSESIPSTFCWIGSGNKEKGFVNLAHSPGFDFDEDALANGIRVHCTFAVNRMNL